MDYSFTIHIGLSCSTCSTDYKELHHKTTLYIDILLCIFTTIVETGVTSIFCPWNEGPSFQNAYQISTVVVNVRNKIDIYKVVLYYNFLHYGLQSLQALICQKYLSFHVALEIVSTFLQVIRFQILS